MIEKVLCCALSDEPRGKQEIDGDTMFFVVWFVYNLSLIASFDFELSWNGWIIIPPLHLLSSGVTASFAVSCWWKPRNPMTKTRSAVGVNTIWKTKPLNSDYTSIKCGRFTGIILTLFSQFSVLEQEGHQHLEECEEKQTESEHLNAWCYCYQSHTVKIICCVCLVVGLFLDLFEDVFLFYCDSPIVPCQTFICFII